MPSRETIERLANALVRLKQRVDRLENMRISPRGYGEIYMAAATDTMASVSTTPIKVDVFDTAGEYRRVVVDPTTDFDMVQSEEASNVYLVSAVASVAPSQNISLTMRVYKGGVATHISSETNLLSATRETISIAGLLRLTSANPITVYVVSSVLADTTLTFYDMVFSMVKVS